MIKFINLKTHNGDDCVINLDAIDTVFPDSNPEHCIIKLRFDDVRDEEAFVYVPYSVSEIVSFLKAQSLCRSL